MKVYVFGSGGQALNIVDVLKLNKEFSPVIVSATNSEEDISWPCPFVSETDLVWSQVRFALVAIGDNFKRQVVTKKIESYVPNVDFPVCVHPSASIGLEAKIGPGTYVGAGSKIGPRCVIGAHSLINYGVMIEHESAVGEWSNLGTGTVIAGGVNMGDRVITGVGTSVLHGIRVGNDALLGSGACVVKDVEPNAVVLGVPGRPVRIRKFGDAFL